MTAFFNDFLDGLGIDASQVGLEKFLGVLMTSLENNGLCITEFHNDPDFDFVG